MTTPIPESSWISANPRQVSVTNAGEAIILDPVSNRYYSLDGVGEFVWGRIQSPVRLADLRDAVVERYEVAPDVALADLRSLLGDLAEVGLVDVAERPG